MTSALANYAIEAGKASEPEKALGLWTRMQEEDVQPSDEFLFTKADQNLTLRDQSQIIEILLKESRLAEASKMTLSMLRNNIHPITRIFNFLIIRLANAGDINTLNDIGSLLTPAKKKLLSFDNRLCYANFVAGRISEYFGELEKEVEQAKDEDLPNLLEAFPRGGAVGILDKDPIERLAEKYASRGITIPLNIVWMKYFVEGRNTEAEKIWSDHLAASPRLMFQSIVRQARHTNDFELINRLIDKLKLAKVSESALGIAYSCAVDVLGITNAI
ncbi:unnamed protein product [Timema podura]|uniref:Pentatricopeptide repeat-containing protein n=1 Tax=Timema podura TaxID=61482 RepID=A0ABN7PBE2_TIMPD|nr:unnamed protein product [Timema podura]